MTRRSTEKTKSMKSKLTSRQAIECFGPSQRDWKTILLAAGLGLAAVTQVVALPTITTPPESRSADLGSEVIFSVVAVSSLPIAYQWRKGTNDLPNETSDILFFASVRTNDAGSYTVVVSDTSGSVTSQVAMLTVAAAFTKIIVGAIVNDGGASVGASWADYDNDGWLDLFVSNTLSQNDFLYHNNGNGTFTRITAGAAVNDGASASGATWGDYDNDGALDLFVATPANNLLYHNQADGTFARITNSIVANDGGTSSSPSWADYDKDGDLDLYVSNNPGPKFLYRNEGNGTFTKVTNGILITDPGNVAGSTWGDYDNDGNLDLFVSGAGNNSVLYHNDGGGNFTKITTGILVNEGTGGFGSAWADYDNDGWLDLFVCAGGLVGPANNFLYHNNGNGTFTKITSGAIVTDSGNWLRAAWGDYDNDSFLDLFVSNYAGNNALYHNNGDGTFTRIVTGSLVNDGGQSAGCGWGDYDNDGFLDLFVANGRENGAENNFLYRNNGNSNSWIKLRLGGYLSNGFGVGARIKLNALISGTNRWLTRSIDGSDVNGNVSALVVGLGDATHLSTLRIEWLSGIIQELHDVAVNQVLTVLEAPDGPPTFHTQPQGQLVLTRSNAMLKASVASLSPFACQWQKDAVAIDGATNTTLMISNAQISESGSYVLVASNSSGATFSQPAVVMVGPLFFVTQPQSQNARAGSNTTFSISVLSGSPVAYQWRYNNTDIANATNVTLIVSNMQAAYEGAYTVLVTNIEASVLSDPANLVLFVNPTFVQAPLSQSVVVGGNLTVSVVITGGPPPFLFQWRRGTFVAGTLTNIVQEERTCFFTLFNIQTNQGGVYRVVITNAASPALSVGANFTITVLPDMNANGLPDAWESTYSVTNAADDADGDRVSNLQEYIAGTDPTNAFSYLKLEQVRFPGSNTLQFIAVSNKTYAVEFTEALEGNGWTRAADFAARATNRIASFNTLTTNEHRFYRVVTPLRP
jgi:enediyne biosynthesis protein E4